MDTFIDSLLREERVCELILPRLTRRDVLEETEGLPPRVSKLEDVLLLGKDGLGAVDAVESPRFRARRDSASGSDASDDSAAEERRERKRRAEKAARIRAQREADAQAQEEIMLGNGGETAMDLDGVESDAGYRSQESDAEDVNGRYRSRSRSVSADRAERFVSRSPSRSRSPEGGSPEGDDDDNGTGYRSRSASRSPDRSPVPDTGYRSRSVSRSPDRF